ncbi:MAG: cytochrome c oxidase subunit 3 [Planctomycetes bacterium]|nr:cytochrome c oxidase subunit 3 [Planctomycetota bacterium]
MSSADNTSSREWASSVASAHAEPVFHAGRCGMVAFLASEVAFFGTLIVAYVKFLGADNGGHTPAKLLHLPTALVNTALLVSSSVTIAWAASALAAGRREAAVRWLVATVLLGCAFLAVTAHEWFDLIEKGLTLSTNLFGTTYFTLIGFHAAHVTLGIVAMSCLLFLLSYHKEAGFLAEPVELTSWYWHFVDGVWIVLLLVVYIIGR